MSSDSVDLCNCSDCEGAEKPCHNDCGDCIGCIEARWEREEAAFAIDCAIGRFSC